MLFVFHRCLKWWNGQTRSYFLSVSIYLCSLINVQATVKPDVGLHRIISAPPLVESSHCRKKIRAMPPKSRFCGLVTVTL